MSFSELEHHVFAYYVANGARDLTMAPKFSPYGELVLVVEDKIQIATRKFGVKGGPACRNVAHAFLDMQIERKGFSTVTDSLCTMHQYQSESYLKCVKELQATNTIILKAQAAGPDFWADSFVALGENP